MALYRHVPGKDALVSMMVDAAIAHSSQAVNGGPPPEGWRESLRDVVGSTWRLCRRQPRRDTWTAKPRWGRAATSSLMRSPPVYLRVGRLPRRPSVPRR